MMMMILLVEPQ